MISEQEALDALDKLGEHLDYPGWLRGIGLMQDENGSYFLSVNVSRSTDEVRTQVPSRIGGVPVQIVEIGTIRLQ